jgi:predicted nucleic acid-binding protein
VIVVADTSVLLNLCRVEQIDLLPLLFSDIVIPPEVAAEFAKLAATTPRFRGLTLPTWIRQQTPTGHVHLPSKYALHAGEIAAISLAVQINADAILIDERSGFAAAQHLGLKTIGILGILLESKASGRLPLVRPIIERLEREGRFWIDEPLRRRVLQTAGE